MPVIKIVSGGQTGVDRAALDVALQLGIPCGGWVPRGRRAEDGRIPSTYPLQEAASWKYDVRTRLNIRDADATLILTRGTPTGGGTALTIAIAQKLLRPCRVVDLDVEPHPEAVGRWLDDTGVKVLNVAGPRESGCPGIYAAATAFLRGLLDEAAR
ncbi:MAG: putative molybdenum carrier protein [Rhodospirillales bacterium]|nr:putative molybdenum carrier protein [Rhodospirillales bacterium]